MLSAIIVAAGSSRRIGFDKLSATIGGKLVIEHSIDAFAQAPSVAEILVVTRSERIPELKKILSGRTKLRELISGGEYRQDSVKAGLQAVASNSKYVAVHDAARPLVKPEQIERTFAASQKSGAASLSEPVSDTLKRADKNLKVCGAVERENLFIMQTPQIFERALLEKAYADVYAAKARVTDEVSAVERIGHKVALVPANDFNFKITYERDLALADYILRTRLR